MPHQTRNDRIYNNTEIQELIVQKAMLMSNSDLDRYCRQDYCKIKFNLNYALFIKADASLSQEKLDEMILDEKDTTGGHGNTNSKLDLLSTLSPLNGMIATMSMSKPG